PAAAACAGRDSVALASSSAKTARRVDERLMRRALDSRRASRVPAKNLAATCRRRRSVPRKPARLLPARARSAAPTSRRAIGCWENRDGHRVGLLAERDGDLCEAEEQGEPGRQFDDLRGGELAHHARAQLRIDGRRGAEEGVGPGDGELVPVAERRSLPAVIDQRDGILVQPLLARTCEPDVPAVPAPDGARVPDARPLLGRVVEAAVTPERAVESLEVPQQRGLVREDTVGGGICVGGRWRNPCPAHRTAGPSFRSETSASSSTPRISRKRAKPSNSASASVSPTRPAAARLPPAP